MLFKRGSTISAAEGGCQAEVGGMLKIEIYKIVPRSHLTVVACSMASAGFAACMGGEERTAVSYSCSILTVATSADPETVLQV